MRFRASSGIDYEGWKTVAFASRFLNSFESRKSINELEFLDVVWAIEYFRFYLIGQKFTFIIRKIIGLNASPICNKIWSEIIAFDMVQSAGSAKTPLAIDSFWEGRSSEAQLRWQRRSTQVKLATLATKMINLDTLPRTKPANVTLPLALTHKQPIDDPREATD